MKRKVNRGYKVRIYPNDEQATLINKTIGCARLIWNYSLMERKEIYELYKDYPELYKSHKNKTQAEWKRDFPFLKEVDSQALATTQQELRQAYSNFYNKSHKHPVFKSKKNNKNSYTTHTTNNNIRIEDNKIKLPKLGWIKLKKKRKQIPDEYILKAATISKKASGKYFVSLRLTFQKEINEIDSTFTRAIGLDFSLNGFYVSSECKKANYPMYLHQSLNVLAKYQRKLSKKVKGSNHYQAQKQKIAILHEKITNQRNDFLHKESRYLVNNYDIISVESLDLTKMLQNKYYSKKITDISYNRFLQYLKYKCEDSGKLFHQVDKYYASSKICSNCGTKKKTLPLSQRVYSCECGNVIDRDLNAALNLAVEGIKTFFKEDRIASIAW